jgi:hypothetical protein
MITMVQQLVCASREEVAATDKADKIEEIELNISRKSGPPGASSNQI